MQGGTKQSGSYERGRLDVAAVHYSTPEARRRPPEGVLEMLAQRRLDGVERAMSTKGTRKGTVCPECRMKALPGACGC